MLTKLLVPFALLVVLSGSAAGQTKFLGNANDARASLDGIVGCIAASNYSCAWKELRPLSVLPAVELNAFEAQFNSQLGAVIRRFGEPLDLEFLHEQQLGTSLVKYEFLVRHEKAPVRWTFIMYRARKGWVLTDFKFDGDLQRFFGSR